ncbi:MAG TPA: ankyrin repeat domain-containing protein [Gemmatimonadaceae bacterium]
MTTHRILCTALILAAAAPLAAQDTRGTPLRVPAAPPRAQALPEAAAKGDIATVRKLIAQHADVNAAQGDGMTALHWAAERGDLALTQVLLSAKANVKATTRIGSYTPLHVAAKSGSGPVVKALLKAGSDPNLMTASGASPLHLAAEAGDPDAVNALIDAKANVNARESEWGQTPLIFAAAADRPAAITALLKHGADPSIRTKSVNLNEQAAQEQAANRRRTEVFISFQPKQVRDSIAKANAAAAAAAPVGRGQQVASAAGAPDAGAGRAGAGGGAGGGGGRGGPQVSTEKLTPAQIQEAITEGRKVLLAPPTRPATEEADTTDGQVAGFAGTVGSMGGMTPLLHAVRQGNLASVIALLDGGADINEPISSDGTTPLLEAAINGQFDVAMVLIQRGANVNTPSSAGATPLYGVLNTQWSPRSRFPQPQAVQNQKAGYLEVMEALLNKGADPNVRIKNNLWYFAYNNCGNAQCGLENLEGTNAFWRAAYAVDVPAMKLLVAHGADYKVPSQRSPQAGGGRGGGRGRGRGGAPLDSAQAAAFAARGGGGGGGFGRGQAGPPLEPWADSASKAVPPGIGVYPIHAAAGVGYGNGYAGNSHRHAADGWLPAMKYLVEELHADVNARDQNGYTALHHAAARGDNEMIKYLVSKGADVKAVSRRGQTTVDMANGPVSRISPIPETIELLEKLGARNSHRCASC